MFVSRLLLNSFRRGLVMGQIFAGPYHRAELGMRKSNQILDYQPQPPEELVQLDTEVDQRGNTTVDHVFKMTREVFTPPCNHRLISGMFMVKKHVT